MQEGHCWQDQEVLRQEESKQQMLLFKEIMEGIMKTKASPLSSATALVNLPLNEPT